MKFNFDKRYLKICKYVGVTAILVYLAFAFIDNLPYFFNNIFSFLGSLWDTIFPMILGLIIAFMFLGPINSIEKLMMKNKFLAKHNGLCRTTGIVVVYLGIISLITALIVGVYFMIGGQISQSSTLSNIVDSIAQYFETNTISTGSLTNFIHDLNLPFGDLISSQVDKIADLLQSIIMSLVGGVANFVISIGSNIFTLIISISFSIYVIACREFFSDLWDKFFYIIFRKRKSGIIIRRSLGIIKTTFSNYIQGQLIEACIVAVLSSIVLSIIGLNYSVVLGVICGIFNLIPYVGPFIGGGIAAIFALFQGELWMIFVVIIAITVVQQIDCNILCPRIVGDKVGLHPALVLVAVSVGGSMYGLLGMVIAVPITASIKTLVVDWFSTYMQADYEDYKKNAPEAVSDNDPIFASLKKKSAPQEDDE